MGLKDEWKNTGKGLGNAFKGLGQNIVKTAKYSIDTEKQDEESNVTNDGSWRDTGKNLGDAFKGLSKSIIDSAKTGLEKTSDALDENK